MAVAAAGDLFEGTVRSASHLAETMNKTNVLFGDSAKIIKDHADAMAGIYSEPKQQILDITDNFALMGKEIGFSTEEAAKFGVKISKMALDARSLGDVETAGRKIEAALAGQSRPLRSLGIFINAATVKEEAARMGMQPGASGQLSEGQKIKARASLIENSEFMRKAAGDLGRTFMETEGQTRAFWGALSNLGTSIGEQINPAWNKLLIDINSGMASLKEMLESNKPTIKAWADSVVDGFETAKVVWRNLPDVFEIALLGADQKMEDARAKIETWATTVAVSVETAFLEASKKVAGFFASMQSGVNAAIGTAVGVGQQVVSGAQSGAGSLSASFDSVVGAVAAKADVAFRPIRDLANFIERKAGAGDYKQMSVEEDIGRLKGSLSGLAPGLGQVGQFLGIFKENLAIPVKPKDEEETALIDKANKHLADTLAQNTDISSKGIAAATARITKREADHLDALANQWIEDTEYDKMFPSKEEKAEKAKRDAEWVPATLKEIMDEARREKLSRKEVWVPATEEQIMAEAARNKAKRDAAEGEDEDVAVLGGKTKHHKGLEDTASFHANLMAEGLGGDVQEKQLTELQMIREADQKNADMMERMYNRSAKAAYA